MNESESQVPDISEINQELIDLMSTIYKSYRLRCLAVLHEDSYHSIHLSKTWQPFGVIDTVMGEYKTDSLLFIEMEVNRKNDEPTSIFAESKIEIGSHEILLKTSGHHQTLRIDRLYRTSTVAAVGYLCESPGIVLKTTESLPPSLKDITERIDEEIRYHPTVPFQDLNRFLRGLGIYGTRDFKQSGVDEYIPFWAWIDEMKVEGTRVNVRFKYHSSMEPRLAAHLSIETVDGHLETQEKGITGLEREEIDRGIVEATGTYMLPTTNSPAATARIALAIDKKYSLHFDSQEISPPKLDLWSIIHRLEKKKGRLLQMLEGKLGKVHVDKLEFSVGILLASLGFRTLYTGEILEPGPDLLAIAPNDKDILIVECGRAKIEQKLSDCAERVDEFGREFPQYRYTGIVFTSSVVPDERRRMLITPGVVLLDERNLKQLQEIAARSPNPAAILNTFLRA